MLSSQNADTTSVIEPKLHHRLPAYHHHQHHPAIFTRIAPAYRGLVMGGYLLILPMIPLLFFNIGGGRGEGGPNGVSEIPQWTEPNVFSQNQTRRADPLEAPCVCVSRLSSFSKRAIGGGQHTIPFFLIYPGAPAGGNRSDRFFL